METETKALQLNLSEEAIKQLPLKERKAFLITLMQVKLYSSPDLQKVWQMEIDAINESYGIKGEENGRN